MTPAFVALALLGVAGAARPGGDGVVRLAVVVGADEGASDEPALRWATQDARAVSQALSELGGVARPALLLDQPVAMVRGAVRALDAELRAARSAGSRTEVFFYYSGHGDERGLHLGGETLAIAELLEAIEGLNPDLGVVILDACRGQPWAREKGAVVMPALELLLPGTRAPRGLVVLRSAARSEAALESDALGGSLFSRHLLAALRGAADADGDGKVTLAEAYDHVYARTLSTSHRLGSSVQHPESETHLAGSGAVVLTRLPTAWATLSLGPDLGGELLVVDDDSGAVIAELDKPFGQVRRVGVPRGRYRVQARSQGQVGATELDVSGGGDFEVLAASLSPQGRSVGREKGAALDPAPYRLAARLLAGEATLLAAPWAVGGGVELERHLSSSRFFVRGALDVVRSRERVGAWRRTHTESHLRLAAGVAARPAGLRLSLDLGAGLGLVHEGAVHDDAERLAELGLGDGATSGARPSLDLSTQALAEVPLGHAASIFFGAAVTHSSLRSSAGAGHALTVRGLGGVSLYF